MIIGVFELGPEQIEVIVDKDNMMFRDASTGTTTTIHGLKLSKSGVVKEHPDLKDDIEWKKKAIERLKKHVKKFKTEDKKISYIKEDLERYGYTALYKQKAGWRPVKF